MKVSGFADKQSKSFADQLLFRMYINRAAEPGEKTAKTMTIAIFPERFFSHFERSKGFFSSFSHADCVLGKRAVETSGSYSST